MQNARSPGWETGAFDEVAGHGRACAAPGRVKGGRFVPTVLGTGQTQIAAGDSPVAWQTAFGRVAPGPRPSRHELHIRALATWLLEHFRLTWKRSRSS